MAADRGEGEAFLTFLLLFASIFWMRRMPFSTLRCSDLELLALMGLEGVMMPQLSTSDVGGELSGSSLTTCTASKGVGGVGGACCPCRPLGSTDRDRPDRLELTLRDLDLLALPPPVGRRAGLSDRSLRRLSERLPPPPLGRAGDELADRRDEPEARGAEADRARLWVLLLPSPLAPEDGGEEGRVLLRPRPWGVLAALAVICDDVVWCDVVDMTSLALLITLSICI